MTEKTLHDLYVSEVRDGLSAEKQLLKALPKMAKAASDMALKKAFKDHLVQTQTHVDRIEELFADLDMKPRAEKCDGMEGLLKEGEKALEDYKAGPVRDAALIAAAQRAEHYEIAAYGTLFAFARELGRKGAATLIQRTLDEERASDQLLTKIAESGVNGAAASEE